MDVSRILATAKRQISSGVTAVNNARRSQPAATVAVSVPLSTEEQAAIQRRQQERSRFSDDAAYFEFLIERAAADDAMAAAAADQT